MAVQNLVFDIFARGGQRVGKTFDDIAGSADGLEGKLGKSGKKAMRAVTNPVVTGFAGAITAGIAGMAVKFGQVAAVAEQNIGAVQTVFGKAAGRQQQFADRSADAVGMSASAYNQLSASIGTSLKQAGVPMDQLAEKNQALIERGADMASVFGGTTSESVAAMGAAFRGEFDSLERWGVQLSASKVSAELAKTGQDKLTGSALEAAKKQAIMNLIMEQSAQVQGNFAREADTTAGAQERATAKWQDAQATLGTALLPAMTAAATIFASFATWLGENSTLVGILVGVIGGLAAAILVINAVIAVTNVLLALNPFSWVIIGVVALIAAIVALVMNWDAVVAWITTVWGGFVIWLQGIVAGFVAWWNGVWAGFVSWTQGLWQSFVGLLTALWQGFVAWIQGIINGFVSWWNAVWTGIRNFLTNVWRNMVDGATSMIGNLIAFFRAMPGRILAVLAGAGKWLVSTGGRLIGGLVNGVKDLAGNLWDFFTGLPGRIAGFLSGAGSWLWSAGKNIVEGLLDGIGSLAGTVGSFFLNLLPGWIVGPFKAALGINSPSKLFRGFGQNIGQGVLQGVSDLAPSIDARMSRLVTLPREPKFDTSGSAVAGAVATGGRYGRQRPTVQVQVNNYNPVAQPASKSLEIASSHLAIGGMIA